MGGGPKPNSNVPIIDVPKWLWRGGVRPNWDNVLKYGFFFILKASLSVLKMITMGVDQKLPEQLVHHLYLHDDLTVII